MEARERSDDGRTMERERRRSGRARRAKPFWDTTSRRAAFSELLYGAIQNEEKSRRISIKHRSEYLTINYQVPPRRKIKYSISVLELRIKCDPFVTPARSLISKERIREPELHSQPISSSKPPVVLASAQA